MPFFLASISDVVTNDLISYFKTLSWCHGYTIPAGCISMADYGSLCSHLVLIYKGKVRINADNLDVLASLWNCLGSTRYISHKTITVEALVHSIHQTLQIENTETPFPKCSSCMMSRYCSPVCQRLDWPSHKVNFLKSISPIKRSPRIRVAVAAHHGLSRFKRLGSASTKIETPSRKIGAKGPTAHSPSSQFIISPHTFSSHPSPARLPATASHHQKQTYQRLLTALQLLYSLHSLAQSQDQQPQ
jgi:hypothetical protein